MKFYNTWIFLYVLCTGCVANTQAQITKPTKQITKPTPAITPNLCSVKQDNDNLIIKIKDYPPLKFISIKIQSLEKKIISISITEEQAKSFLQQAQLLLSNNSAPIYPFLFKAVSDNAMPIVMANFWIQQNTINSKIYEAIIANGKVDKTSYNESQKVIQQLNNWCKDKVQFELPEEKHFVYLARAAYNPLNSNQLKQCAELQQLEPYGVKQLLAHKWQLTKSLCQPLGINNESNSIRNCDEQSYVKKGGSLASKDATECMPEYRAESTPDINEPNTTFRLLIKKIKH